MEAKDDLSKEELERLIQEKALDALREIDALIEGQENPEHPKESDDEGKDSEQILYLR